MKTITTILIAMCSVGVLFCSLDSADAGALSDVEMGKIVGADGCCTGAPLTNCGAQNFPDTCSTSFNGCGGKIILKSGNSYYKCVGSTGLKTCTDHANPTVYCTIEYFIVLDTDVENSECVESGACSELENEYCTICKVGDPTGRALAGYPHQTCT